MSSLLKLNPRLAKEWHPTKKWLPTASGFNPRLKQKRLGGFAVKAMNGKLR
jgi:hypothetical protein